MMDGFMEVDTIASRISDFMVDNRRQFIGALVLAVIFVVGALVLGVSVYSALVVWMFMVILQFAFLILWEVQDVIEGQQW